VLEIAGRLDFEFSEVLQPTNRKRALAKWLAAA
jgi:hypothetical protein